MGTRETGRVLEVSGAIARVKVHPASTESCSGCTICEGGDQEHILELPAPPGLEAGQTVLIELPPEGDLGAAVVVFLVPVTALVLGAIVGSMVPIWISRPGLSSTLFAVLGGLLCLGVSAVGIRKYDRRFRRRAAGPRVVKILS